MSYRRRELHTLYIFYKKICDVFKRDIGFEIQRFPVVGPFSSMHKPLRCFMRLDDASCVWLFYNGLDVYTIATNDITIKPWRGEGDYIVQLIDIGENTLKEV